LQTIQMSIWASGFEKAPHMGLAKPIERGGLFPTTVPSPMLTLDELSTLDVIKSNHPSFNDLHGEDEPPGVALLEDQLNKGFALLFKDKAAAEVHLGDSTHPAPLGNISKAKPDGSVKHRLIQDQRRNHVNAAVALTERHVLPRPIDHARDVGLLLEGLRHNEVVTVFILDFKDAFMSIPLHPDEMRFNCAEVKEI
jgi:hypothetical protein